VGMAVRAIDGAPHRSAILAIGFRAFSGDVATGAGTSALAPEHAEFQVFFFRLSEIFC
jgi:hypothetical protein